MTDSAGVPWAGRSFSASPFETDDGSADPLLLDALTAYQRDLSQLGRVVAAVAASRLLVPVVATEQEAGTSAVSGMRVDRSADMALVTLRGKDGRIALPVFTSVTTLSAWDAEARPVPVDPRAACLSAVEEGADVLVLDVAGPVSVLLPRPAVWAVAQGRPWTPSPQDPDVHRAVTAAAAPEPYVRHVRCEPGDRAELRVVLALRPGLDREAVDQLTQRIAQRLAADEVVAERVDSVEMRLTSA